MHPPPESTLARPSVPLVRLDHADPELLDELLAAVSRVAAAGAFTGGEEVEAFEEEFARYCGSAHAVGVSSGTEALALALRALGVGPGDEVIVPANSFIATAEAVTLVGATPRPIDVDPTGRTITAEGVRAALNLRTRCVIPVHLHGRTVEMDELMALARARELFVVEDACQAHGALYKGRRVGSIGDIGCFSFYPSKNLGAWGDGGAVVTDEPELADRVSLLQAHGERPRYNHRVAGTTARLDAIQAAVLRIKLARLDGWNERRRDLARRLRGQLAGAEVGLPASAPDGLDEVFHHFVVTSERRDALREHLDRRGIATGVHYPIPIHLTEAYAALGMGPGSLPVAERLAAISCSLPLSPLHEEGEVDLIAGAVHEFGGAADG
jgi:dTDP-3-amino-3,4,6-trideoxy-alpha-D-glucose transaminase